jgi:sugar phosphate isomerase/epimerase
MRLATTAFSFTNEWLTRRYSLEQLLRRVAERDLGPGIELVGFQSWRRYPSLAAEDVLSFRRLVDALELEPAALGAYVDLARRPDRPMSTSEAVEFLRPQLDAAEALGFPLLRLHGGIPPVVLEQLAPVAERAGVTLATEIQGGQTPDDPGVQALLECRVALVLDASIAMKAVPKRFVETVRALGMHAEDLDALLTLWAERATTRELFAAVQEIDAPPAALDEARAGFIRFGRQEPYTWLPYIPHVAYVHAKFWELDDDGDDPTTRTAELISVLRAGGYEGFLACEWGGNAWLEADDVDAFEIVRRHHERCRRLVASPAVEVPA